MSVYSVYTKIESNVPANNLLYDLSIYRMDENKRKIYLLPLVSKQSLQSNYETLKHQTVDTDDPLITTYIVEIMLYRKNRLLTQQALKKPFRRLYTLEDLTLGKACSEKKRENACYFESSGQTKLANEGDNTIKLQLTVPERQFIAKEYPIGSAKDPFEKSLFEFELLQRMDHFDYPNQGGASLCGPATFFYCLLRDRPDIYEQAAKELWQYGRTKIGGLEIVPRKGCRNPNGHFNDAYGSVISGLDWVTLASLRDTESTILSFDTIDSPVSGATTWWVLAKWFEKAGYEKVFSNVGITQAGIKGINDLNKYTSEKGYKVVTLICDSLLENSASPEALTVPTHWIIWNGAVTQAPNGDINLQLFSWGTVGELIKKNKDINFFIKRFFGGMVFKPLK